MVVLFKGIKSNAAQYGYNDFLDKLLSSAGFKTGYINESYGEGEIKSFCRWKVVQLRYLPYDPFYTRFFWTWIVELLNASGLNEGCKKQKRLIFLVLCGIIKSKKREAKVISPIAIFKIDRQGSLIWRFSFCLETITIR